MAVEDAMPCQLCAKRLDRRTLCFPCYVAARGERLLDDRAFDPARPLQSHRLDGVRLSPRQIAHRAAMLAHLRHAAAT